MHLSLQVPVALHGLGQTVDDAQIGEKYLLGHAEYAIPDAGLVLLNGVVLQVVEYLLKRGRVRRVHHAHRLQLEHRLQVRALRERQRLDDLRRVRLIETRGERRAYLGKLGLRHLVVLERRVVMQLGLEMLFGEQDGRLDRYGRHVLVPRPDVLVGEAEHDAEEPKVPEELEQARMRLDHARLEGHAPQQATYARYQHAQIARRARCLFVVCCLFNKKEILFKEKRREWSLFVCSWW